jgi:hypothetical protein
VSLATRLPLLLSLLCSTAGTLAAQATVTSPSPTLPSDTLEANFAPPMAAGPMPELAPSLPSDTLDATQPVDSFPTADPQDSDSTSSLAPPDESSDDEFTPQTPGDSAALRELRSWIKAHPGLTMPPPRRAVLAEV